MKTKMRNTLLAMLLVLSVIWLAACGEGEKSTNTPEASSAVEQGDQQDQASDKDKDQADDNDGKTGAGTTSQADKDLFVAVVGESSNLNSFTVEMTADQKIAMDGTSRDTVTSSTMDVTVKPDIAFKQLTKVEAEGITQEIESYYTSEGFFLKDPASGSWMKLPQEMMDMALQGASQDALDPSAQLKELIDYTDQFAVVEKDGVYTFTLTAAGEAFEELIQKNLDQQELALPLPSDSMNIKHIQYEIKHIQYEIEVEKESNKLLSMSILTDMSFNGEEETQNIDIVSDIKMIYYNHNAVDAIVVPEEALQAEEISLD